MKKNQVFKEIEARIVEISGRPFISIDDLEKIISDIIFTKSNMDVPTLRTIKRLVSSIALSYKALKENGELDLNEELAIVPLSKKKVKKLVLTSLKLAKKDNESLDTDFEELEPYLAEEGPSLALSAEEAEAVIQGGIQVVLEPYLESIQQLIEEALQASKKPTKPVNKPDKPGGKKKSAATDEQAILEEIASETE